ncbi:folylpolyglutamate synthase/dihydrofolate synthase family protein [Anaerolentibacter hominis]|uniref:bifunctional folylpolyglutamate synthase/dihydrofolate synthase n=1 Tax=Anaerolentibacter hominis TaxID=3079009 RepID=UPI0031B82673
MTYQEAMEYIEAASRSGSVLGLDTMRELMERLGNPQNKLNFVHVAGTNGKGSSAAFMSFMLAAAGRKAGRYISPTIFEYRERLQITEQMGGRINTRYITEAETARYVERVKEAAEKMDPQPTVFEIETAMGFLFFLDQDCDYVVLEVGLGGREDATNVISTSVCSVFSSISRDHMQFLGNTLAEIAWEKAGIMKPGGLAVSINQKGEVRAVLEEEAKKQEVSLYFADRAQAEVKAMDMEETVFSLDGMENLSIHLLGKNQVENAVLAVEAVKKFLPEITPAQIREGLNSTFWQGRFQVIHKDPYIIVDGAHNEGASLAMRENIKTYLADRRLIYVMGVFADKDYEVILKNTAEFASEIITIQPDNKRALPSSELAGAARRYCSCVTDAKDPAAGLKLAIQKAGKKDAILTFGSLSFIKEMTETAGMCYYKE